MYVRRLVLFGSLFRCVSATAAFTYVLRGSDFPLQLEKNYYDVCYNVMFFIQARNW